MKSKPKLLKAIEELLAIDHRSVPFSQAVRETQQIAKKIRKILGINCVSPHDSKLRDIFLRNERECLRRSIDQYEAHTVEMKIDSSNNLVAVQQTVQKVPPKNRGTWKVTGTTTSDLVWRTS